MGGQSLKVVTKFLIKTFVVKNDLWCKKLSSNDDRYHFLGWYLWFKTLHLYDLLQMICGENIVIKTLW